MFKKMILVGAALIALASPVFAQNGAFPNYPIVGGAAYSCGSVNGVSNCTVPAGPSVVTGNENIPANTNLTGGRTPQNVLLGLASLNALPVTVVTVTTPPVGISATSISGGVIYNSLTTITSANITLPSSPIDGQQYLVSSNRTITTLSITGAALTSAIQTNAAPTVLTASTTVPQGYVFRFDAGTGLWFRTQ